MPLSVGPRKISEDYRVCYVALSTGNVMNMYKSIGWEGGWRQSARGGNRAQGEPCRDRRI